MKVNQTTKPVQDYGLMIGLGEEEKAEVELFMNWQ